MIPPLNLSNQEQLAQTATSGGRTGNQRGGGQRFNFGGINDSPGGKWLWLGLTAAAALAGALLWFNRRPSRK